MGIKFDTNNRIETFKNFAIMPKTVTFLVKLYSIYIYI